MKDTKILLVEYFQEIKLRQKKKKTEKVTRILSGSIVLSSLRCHHNVVLNFNLMTNNEKQ